MSVTGEVFVKFYFEDFDWYLPREFKFVKIGPKYQELYMKA